MHIFLTFHIALPSVQNLYLNQWQWFVQSHFLDKFILRTSFSFSIMILLNSGIHNLRNTTFLCTKVGHGKDDPLYFPRLRNSVNKYVISSNWFRFLTIVWKEFCVWSKRRENNPYNLALHKICIKNKKGCR